VPVDAFSDFGTSRMAQFNQVVPASAVVDTGDRQVVWRQGEGECSPQAAEVEVAARAGAYWAIAKGLAEGDRVVIHGAFLLKADERLASGAPAMGAAARSGAREND
jgi:Cu(I)/Ag(I) efflux system membrane fusion protein